MRHSARLALVIATALPVALDPARAQLISVKTAPIADGGQFAFFPSANLGMGGVSIALPDSTLDPFTNPATSSRSGGARVFGAPTFFSVTRKSGGGLTLPLGASYSRGAWFTQVMIAMQDVDRAGTRDQVLFPPNALAGGSSDVVGVVDDRKQSRENRYIHALLGRRLGGGLSIATSASWWRLNALDGVELYYPRSQGLRQAGQASDLRFGVLEDMGRGRSIEAVLVHNRMAVDQDVAFADAFWDPTLRQFTVRGRLQPNADESDTWGLHVAYLRPLADSTWRVGAVLTGNRISQPRLPDYELPEVPADAGRSQAYNVGGGVSRTSGPWTLGFDAIYEPIWSRTWVRADAATAARDGSPIDAGAKTLDSRFRFNNGIARLGFGAAVPMGKDQSLTFETGGQLRAIRYRLEQQDMVQQSSSASTQHWNEWTRSWGIGYRVAGAVMHYRGNLTTGASRPGFDDNGTIIAVAPTLDSRPLPGFGSSVPFGLRFGKVRTTMHQISFSVPLR
jgi:hypothetical protein